MEPGKVGTSDGAGGVAGPGPPHRAAAPRHSPARGLSGPHSWRLARYPRHPRHPALVSCRLDNTRILATDTLRAECREGGGGGGGCRGMAAVINMRVAAGGGEVNHGPARGAARREKGGSWWQAARAQPPGGQASTHFPTINTQPCWPGRAGLGWAGLGRAGLGGRYQLVSARQPAQPAAILPVTAAPPSALLHNLLHPGVWLLRPRRGPSWLPAPAAEEGSYQGSLGPVLGPRLELAEEVNK